MTMALTAPGRTCGKGNNATRSAARRLAGGSWVVPWMRWSATSMSQRHAETGFEVMIESLHLAFGFCPIGAAQARAKAIGVCEIEHALVPAVLAFSICIAFNHNSAGVIKKHRLGHTTEVCESAAQAIAQGI